MTLSLRILKNDEIDEFIAFRRQVYIAKHGKLVNTSYLDWTIADQGSIHLLIWDENSKEYLSSLRFTVFKHIPNLEKALRLSLQKEMSLPAVLLSRGVTKIEFSNQGFHSILRAHALQMALKFGFSHVFGTMEVSEPRLKNLLALGYEIIQVQDGWPNGIIKNQSSVALLHLQSEFKIQKAINLLHQKYDNIIFKLNNDFENLVPTYL